MLMAYDAAGKHARECPVRALAGLAFRGSDKPQRGYGASAEARTFAAGREHLVRSEVDARSFIARYYYPMTSVRSISRFGVNSITMFT